MEIIRIYVGADRSQALAVKVLEHSIRRHSSSKIEIIPMIDLPVPLPKDPRQRPRTGFSFARFCIPRLAGFQGRAIYMDADMLVFQDIRQLWEFPLNGKKVLIQKEAHGAKRIKQCAVMVLDCGRLGWKIEEMVAGIDAGKYGYEDLVYHLCLLAPEEIGYDLPSEWNSLETVGPTTCNLHYTDMNTQPWVSSGNRNDGLWLDEVRRMLDDGSLSLPELQKEIEEGFFRPSLLVDLRLRPHIPRVALPLWRRSLKCVDKLSGYIAHRAVTSELVARA